MSLHGHSIVGGEPTTGSAQAFQAFDPRTGDALHGEFHEATAADVDRALRLAAEAHPAYERAGREKRAAFLEAIASGIEGLGDALLERASAESGLPLARFQGERGRTCAQLRMFASVLREGAYLDVRVDRAQPDREPLPKPDVRSMRRALGPVAVFGASNFPLAFSVAGGDTASALAAGCPVVVKAHPNHPGTSELVGGVIADAVRACELPVGVFALVQGSSTAVGKALVEHESTEAVGFTGSLRGGRALFDLAAQRPRPIPVFAEMGSVNPSFFLPGRLAEAGEQLGEGLAGSVMLGVGQFCTNPGVVVLERGADAEAFIEKLREGLAAGAEAPMLHAGIRSSYDDRLEAVAGTDGVETLHRAEAAGVCGARPALFSMPAEVFLANAALREEVFGPATIVVTCKDAKQVLEVARAFDGQLTATIHASAKEDGAYEALLPILEQRAGRLLFGGFPTGVEVCHAMVHGGPYPATTDSRSTSVGTGAIERFVRPVAYQNFPQALLPEELRD